MIPGEDGPRGGHEAKMAQDIVIPTVGESVTSGVIAAWTKGDGEWVDRDETVIELETDKITMEIPSPASGVLKHGAAEGDTVEIGAVVGSVDETAKKPAGVASASTASASESSASADAGGSGAQQESPAPRGGGKKEGAAGGTPGSGGAAAAAPAASRSPGVSGETNGDVPATPLAKKLARERGIELHGIRGTGPGGKVREHDVLAVMRDDGGGRPGGSAPAGGAAVSARGVSVERMSPIRQRIASRLVEAQQTAAMLTTFNEVDMSAVMETRAQYKESFSEKHGVGLGFMSFFVKAAASALRAFPQVNSYVVADAEGKPAIESHDYCDIAIAVSSPKGLVVPVLRNAEGMSFAQIETAIKDFGGRAKSGKLSLEEMQGGTFTITNGGVFGSLLSTPILNPPQSAILGMHGIKNRAVEHREKPGEIALRPMMYLALSYDHRIVDGAEAVQFLVHIRNAIEDPKRLMLEL